jgi:hypothetical protein
MLQFNLQWTRIKPCSKKEYKIWKKLSNETEVIDISIGLAVILSICIFILILALLFIFKGFDKNGKQI